MNESQLRLSQRSRTEREGDREREREGVRERTLCDRKNRALRSAAESGGELPGGESTASPSKLSHER